MIQYIHLFTSGALSNWQFGWGHHRKPCNEMTEKSTECGAFPTQPGQLRYDFVAVQSGWCREPCPKIHDPNSCYFLCIKTVIVMSLHYFYVTTKINRKKIWQSMKENASPGTFHDCFSSLVQFFHSAGFELLLLAAASHPRKINSSAHNIVFFIMLFCDFRLMRYFFLLSLGLIDEVELNEHHTKQPLSVWTTERVYVGWIWCVPYYILCIDEAFFLSQTQLSQLLDHL